MRDTWTAYQFDSAIIYGGIWIQNRLEETDDKGKRLYDLKYLLTDWSKQRNLPYNELMSHLAKLGLG